MKVVYKQAVDRDIQVDTQALAEFMRAVGSDEEKIDRLRIVFWRDFPHDVFQKAAGLGVDVRDIGGSYDERQSVIFIFTHARKNPEVINQTLLHELKHHLQPPCCLKSDRAYPYAERYCELEARLFASVHRNHQFITIDGYVPDDSVVRYSSQLELVEVY